MPYAPIFIKNEIRMNDIAKRMSHKITKEKKNRWEKKVWRWIEGKKKFRIYSMRIGQSVKYKLAFNESSFLWEEISAPGRSSWECKEENGYLYFRMLIDGVCRSNEIRQSKIKKEE